MVSKQVNRNTVCQRSKTFGLRSISAKISAESEAKLNTMLSMGLGLNKSDVIEKGILFLFRNYNINKLMDRKIEYEKNLASINAEIRGILEAKDIAKKLEDLNKPL